MLISWQSMRRSLVCVIFRCSPEAIFQLGRHGRCSRRESGDFNHLLAALPRRVDDVDEIETLASYSALTSASSLLVPRRTRPARHDSTLPPFSPIRGWAASASSQSAFIESFKSAASAAANTSSNESKGLALRASSSTHVVDPHAVLKEAHTAGGLE